MKGNYTAFNPIVSYTCSSRVGRDAANTTLDVVWNRFYSFIWWNIYAASLIKYTKKNKRLNGSIIKWAAATPHTHFEKHRRLLWNGMKKIAKVMSVWNDLLLDRRLVKTIKEISYGWSNPPRAYLNTQTVGHFIRKNGRFPWPHCSRRCKNSIN